MADRRRGTRPPVHQHRHTTGQRDCLYETALRSAIAAQHGLSNADRLTLRMCEGCGKPCLLSSVWLPFSEEGELACPRCGTIAESWNGTRAFVAYWQREADEVIRV